MESGKKVIALIQLNPLKSESNELKQGKLIFFKDKVKRGKLVQFWNDIEDISTKLNMSLTETIEYFPSKGWIHNTFNNSPLKQLQLIDIDSAIHLYKIRI